MASTLERPGSNCDAHTQGVAQRIHERVMQGGEVATPRVTDDARAECVPLMRELLARADHSVLDALCRQYSGLRLFAKFLEARGRAIPNNDLPPPRAH